MARVSFQIVKAYPDSDDRGRPILTYEIRDDRGAFNRLNTPIGSQLSRLLRPDLEREDDIQPPEFSDLEET